MDTYEKKYREANDKVAARFGTNVAKEIFTDLYESEDERTRKEIIKYIEGTFPNESSGIESKNKWLAWLEKKSADKVEPRFRVGDKIYLKPEYRMPNDDTPIANTVKEIKEIDNGLYRFEGAYIFIEDQDKYELVRQKPWSPGDENKINHLIAYFEDREGFTAEDDVAYANWLKSLKDRVQPGDDWKPSEDQMDALYTYIYNPQYFNTPDPRMELVISIYEDLKKLMEE